MKHGDESFSKIKKNKKQKEQTATKKVQGKRIKSGKTKSKANIILNILLILFVIAFLYSGYQVLTWVKSDQETKALEEGLFADVVIKPEEENAEEIIDFQKLEETNKDVVGWIKIDNTYINYPIMQGKTDEYYLRKDINGNYNIAGSIFIYASTNSNFTDENTIIFGHNMKNGRMFSDLKKINEGELGNDVEIKIFTKDELNKYKVFSTYVEEPSENLFETQYTKNEKEEFIENAIEKSIVNFNTKPENADEKIITLITCYKVNTRRIVVHAVKMPN